VVQGQRWPICPGVKVKGRGRCFRSPKELTRVTRHEHHGSDGGRGRESEQTRDVSSTLNTMITVKRTSAGSWPPSLFWVLNLEVATVHQRALQGCSINSMPDSGHSWVGTCTDSAQARATRRSLVCKRGVGDRRVASERTRAFEDGSGRGETH
jgi:hypothetical protein